MVTRQFRLLIQAREILDSGGSEDGVRSQLNLHPWVAQKVTAQARQFSLPALDGIYHQLLKIDVGGKSGGMPVEPRPGCPYRAVSGVKFRTLSPYKWIKQYPPVHPASEVF